jgi:DNA-binding CsgD family transcriptional regulator
MDKREIIANELSQGRRWSLLAGVIASIFSLMFGLLIQTGFYEIARDIPPIIQQDSHISLPLCNTFPDLYGCNPWVGALTSLELLELSILLGQLGGLTVNLTLVTAISIWVIVRVRSDSVLLGLMVGISSGITSLLLALIFNIPLSLLATSCVYGIMILLLLPLSGFIGGQLGKQRLVQLQSNRLVHFIPIEDEVGLDGSAEVLSRRELEVLALVATGYKNNEIAQELFISEATVKTHLQHIYGKMGVNNRTAAVTSALASGWLIREGTAESE